VNFHLRTANIPPFRGEGGKKIRKRIPLGGMGGKN